MKKIAVLVIKSLAALTFLSAATQGFASVPPKAKISAPAPSVGPIELGAITMQRAEQILGNGRVTTGTYPSAARAWHLQGGCLMLDGDKYSGDNLVVDTVTWSNAQCSGPPSKITLTFHGAAIGTSKLKLVHLLGGNCKIVRAYNRMCCYWQFPEHHSDALSVYAAFKNDRVSFLSVFLSPSD